MFGCSLFALFSVSTVGLEPSEMTLAMSLPTEINEFTKCQIKHGKRYFATILDGKKEDEDVCIVLGECRL